MILLTHLEHPRYALALADYLSFRGIQVHLQAGPGFVSVYLVDAARMDEARQELERFLGDKDHARYRLASWNVEGSRVDMPSLAPYYEGQSIRQVLTETGPVTRWIFVACALVFIVTGQGTVRSVRAPLMFFPDVLAMGDWQQAWRWITPVLVHFGVWHFVFNLLSWWVFAGLVERMQSSLRLLALFLVCAVASNWTEFLWSRDNFGGLSGVVYGLVGYLWFYGRFRPESRLQLPPAMVGFMLVALAAGFTNFMPIANMAHLGGLLTGCLLGLACAKLDAADRRDA